MKETRGALDRPGAKKASAALSFFHANK